MRRPHSEDLEWMVHSRHAWTVSEKSAGEGVAEKR